MVRKFPTKALFVMAIALFSVGTLVGALALNFPMLLAARLIMALGTGVSLPLLTNIILDKAPFHKRGMMLGLVSLVTCAAPAIGAGVRRIGDGIPELALDFLCHDSVPGDFVRAWRGYRA